MAKKNLFEFAETFEANKTKVDLSSFMGFSVDKRLSEFEKHVINEVADHSGYRHGIHYQLLSAYFKKGGKLVENKYFLDNISNIKLYLHGRGGDLVYAYSKNVIKGRLPSGIEPIFLRDMWKSHYGSRTIYKYAKYVIRDRLPVEYEKDCNDLDYLNFVSSKGHDIAEILINSTNLSFYYYRKYCYLPEVVHNFMIAMQLSGDYYANVYFRQRNRDDKLIRGRLKMVDPNKTVGDVVRDLKG